MQAPIVPRGRLVAILALSALIATLLSGCGRPTETATAAQTEPTPTTAAVAEPTTEPTAEPEAEAGATASPQTESPLDTPAQPDSPLSSADQPDSPLDEPSEADLAAEAIFAAGTEATQAGDYAEARALYDEALADGLDHPRIHEGLGDLNQALQQYAAAVENYTTALAQTETAALFLKRCTSGIYIDRFEPSVLDCESALDLDPTLVDALLSLAELHQEDNKQHIARALVAAALELSETARAYYLLGVIDLDEEKWDDALANLTRSIELDPTSQETYWNRSMLYLAMGESEKVVEDMYAILEVSSPKTDGEWMVRASSQIRLLTGEYPTQE